MLETETKTLKEGEFYVDGGGAPNDSNLLIGINGKWYVLRAGTYYGLREGKLHRLQKAYEVTGKRPEEADEWEFEEITIREIEDPSKLEKLARVIIQETSLEKD